MGPVFVPIVRLEDMSMHQNLLLVFYAKKANRQSQIDNLAKYALLDIMRQMKDLLVLVVALDLSKAVEGCRLVSFALKVDSHRAAFN
jgi:hypothetical protein